MQVKETFDFEAIGTKWVIDLYDNPVDRSILENKITREISNFSEVFSRFDPDSEISKVANHVGKIIIPENYLEIIPLYEKLYKITDGKFTPLVGNLLEDAGYDKDYSLTLKKLRVIPKWEEVIYFNPPTLEIKKPSVLDFGAAGKGFLVDLIGKIIEENQVNNYCIDAGGDIIYKTKGEEFLKVGLENPDNFKQVIGVCNIKNQSLCGSSGNRRKWGNFNHIMNPENLKSVEDIKAIWVVAENGLIADGLSTVLFLTDPKNLKRDFSFEYLKVLTDGTFVKSENFPGEVFTN